MNDTITDIISDIRCLVCESQTIAESNSAFANDIKQYVEKSLNAGLSKDEILAFLVERYGEFILFSPNVSKYTILLWLLPIIILLLLSYSILKNKQNKFHNNYNQTGYKKTNPVNTKFIISLLSGGIILTTFIYSKIGSFGMGDYPQDSVVYSNQHKKIELLIKKSRNWRSTDGFESPRITKLLQQILAINNNNTEANWFMAIHHLENSNLFKAEYFYNIALNSTKDPETKKFLQLEWNKIFNKR